MKNDKFLQLLRNDVKDLFSIIECEITIHINDDLKSALYAYDYTIKKTNKGNNIWREVFGYSLSSVDIKGAYPGKFQGFNEITKTGLNWNVDSFNTDNTVFIIQFNENIQANQTYEFHYIINTKIESLKNFMGFGGTGNVWYWIAQEFKCDNLTVKIKLPKGVTYIKSEPNYDFNENGYYIYNRKSLFPKEFFLTLITYEKRILNISPKYYPIIDRLVFIILGSILGAILSIIFQRLFIN